MSAAEDVSLAPAPGGRGRSALARVERRDGYLYILPWAIGFVVFFMGPMLASLVLSFTEWQILLAPKWVWLRNYQVMFAGTEDFIRDRLITITLLNTGSYAFFSVVLYTVLALFLSLALNPDIRGMRIYRTMYFVPSVTPIVASTLMWIILFHPSLGAINFILSAFGIPKQGFFTDVGQSKPTLIFMHLWTIGGALPIYLAGLKGIPEELYEAARIDGAGLIKVFRYVTLPLLSPTIFFVVITGFIGGFQVFTQAYIATGGGPQNSTLFYVLYLYNNAFLFFKMGYASAMAWILFVIILAFTVIQFWVAQRWVYYERT